MQIKSVTVEAGKKESKKIAITQDAVKGHYGNVVCLGIVIENPSTEVLKK